MSPDEKLLVIANLVDRNVDVEDDVAAVRRVVDERNGLIKALDALQASYDKSQRTLRARAALVEEIEKATEVLGQIVALGFRRVDTTQIEELRAEVELAQRDSRESRTSLSEAGIYIEALECMVVACIGEMAEPKLRAARLEELEAMKRAFHDRAESPEVA